MRTPFDLSGLYELRRLRDLSLWLNGPRADDFRLDLARLRKLTRLIGTCSRGFEGRANLDRLVELQRRHVRGEKRLDFSCHPRLRVLNVGPASGTESVCLEGLKLRNLTLVCMARLKRVDGSEFLATVNELDIRGSNLIPRSLLGRFTALTMVTIGMRSSLAAKDFARSHPKIVREAV